jgi:hypothetical protein
MTVNDPGVGSEDTDGNAVSAAQIDEIVTNSDLDDAAIPQSDDRSAIVTFDSFSSEIPESDSRATLDEEGQFHPSIQGDFIASPSCKRSRSLSGSDQADGRGSDWAFDVFAEDDGSSASKRARSSPRPSEFAENGPPPAAPVKTVQIPGSAHGDRPPRSNRQCEVHQIVGESRLEYQVTALTRIWLPKASVDTKLVRKYRAEQRATTRVRTRWSSRLQNKK